MTETARLGTLTEYVVLDTETTGLDHKTEQLIEIGAVKVVNEEIVATFSELIKPTVPIRHSSYRIHHISEEMVADAPGIEEVMPRFLEFVGDLPYVAHNAIFDYSFINEACKKLYERRFTNHRIDTFEMYRSVFPDDPSHGLSSLASRFGQPPDVLHRALDDATKLALVYPRLRALYEQKFSWQLSQLGNVPYLMERYLRIQRAIHAMQAEMADLKDIFKLYFLEGGKSVEASTGELMLTSYKRSYEYDDKRVWPLLKEADIVEKTSKINPRQLDKVIDSGSLDPEMRERLLECRKSMSESRSVTFVKPQPLVAAEDSEEPSS